MIKNLGLQYGLMSTYLELGKEYYLVRNNDQTCTSVLYQVKVVAYNLGVYDMKVINNIATPLLTIRYDKLNELVFENKVDALKCVIEKCERDDYRTVNYHHCVEEYTKLNMLEQIHNNI